MTIEQNFLPTGLAGPEIGNRLAAQPYQYRRRELVEPDWTRLPGWRDVTRSEWESAQWQRAHCVKNLRQLRDVYGDLIPETFYRDLEHDQAESATMPLLIPPQMVNTIVPGRVPDLDAVYADPVRRYMLPVASDRDREWPSHPHATRDSLHEKEMWLVEGLTQRYPTKVLAELLATCPQYCGHCTRMDLVGTSTIQFSKLKLETKQPARLDGIIDHLQRSPQIRDVVVSGGDVANVPWRLLEDFLTRLLAIDSIRDIRLATKALMGLPQHWLQDDIVRGMERVATLARGRGVNIAIHTHVNTAQSVTPLFARAAKTMLETGIRDVRNQGVLMRNVNDSPDQLLDLCFALLDEAGVIPYYFYMCDMIPNSEHWRLAVWEAQEIQDQIMGYLPGFATPRIVCDVPYLGKRWVHQLTGYDRTRGVSHWTKNYLTSIEADDPAAAYRLYEYFDPIRSLPGSGQMWWRREFPATDRSPAMAGAPACTS
ncbi:KamA family radical SAM protein [Pseudonocardia xinjiangensis]|uniref:KamA family radical SAM protein n=1 Tax=Pseudonocardia xinjiangensis TaxID=75289 RepID=UPI003D91EF24